MKKPIAWLFLLFAIASCTTMQQMNSNMEHANELMAQNTATMTKAQETIEKNTVVIEESTATTKDAGGFLSIFMIIYLIILLVPAFFLYRLYHKLTKSINNLIDKRK